MTCHPKDAFDTAQTGAFIIGIDDLCLLRFGVRNGGIQDAAPSTVFALILLFAFGVVPILNYLLAITVGTMVNDFFSNHVADSTLSLAILPLPIICLSL